MSNTMCPLPWNHISMVSNGDLRMCCQCIYGDQGVLTDEGGKALNAATTSLKGLQNHPLLKEVRASMLRGEKHPQCQLCWMEEANNLRSRRQNELRETESSFVSWAKEHTAPDGSVDESAIKPRSFDIRFGVKCNLKCRMCGPRDSSFWLEDYVALKGWDAEEVDPYVTFSTGNVPIERKNGKWTYQSDKFFWYEDSVFLKSLYENLEAVDHFYFTGGEPMLLKQHWDLLRACVDAGVSSKIYLQYNTNGTLLRPEQLDLLSRFKKVGVGVSVDAIGPLGEYIRHPSKWEVVKKNVESLGFSSNIFFISLTPTISIFNVLGILDLITWLSENPMPRLEPVPSIHILENPSHQSVQVLPKFAKTVVEYKYKSYLRRAKSSMSPANYGEVAKLLNSILQYMKAEDKSSLLDAFIQETQALDRLRKETFETAAPEVNFLLNFYGSKLSLGEKIKGLWRKTNLPLEGWRP